MKKLILGLSVICLAFVSINAQAQAAAQAAAVVTKEDKAGAKIVFEKNVHDYGTIKKLADGTCNFEFVNEGSEPLVISKCKGSCGCTVPTWPKQAIAPGESASIKVKYDTKRIGGISKTVTIWSNAVNEPIKTVRIKGKVVDTPKADTKAKSEVKTLDAK